MNDSIPSLAASRVLMLFVMAADAANIGAQFNMVYNILRSGPSDYEARLLYSFVSMAAWAITAIFAGYFTITALLEGVPKLNAAAGRTILSPTFLVLAFIVPGLNLIVMRRLLAGDGAKAIAAWWFFNLLGSAAMVSAVILGRGIDGFDMSPTRILTIAGWACWLVATACFYVVHEALAARFNFEK